MKDRIRGIKACADQLEGIGELDVSEQQKIVNQLFGRIADTLLEAGLDADLIASGYVHHAIFVCATRRATSDEPHEVSRAGFLGLTQILSAATPEDREDCLQEAYRLAKPLWRRLNSFAEQEGRRRQESDDYEALFARGARADFRTMDAAEADLIAQIGEISTAQELIHRGHELIKTSYGQHRAAQHTFRCLAAQLESLADPEAAARSAYYAQQLAQLDAEAEDEKAAEEARGIVDLAFSETGVPAATEPLDSSDDAFSRLPLARTVEDGSLDEVEDLTPEFAFPDWLTAKWYALFYHFGWNVEARDADGDPRLPCFVIHDLDAGPIDAFTVEDSDLLSASPDSDTAIQSWGAHYRKMTTRAILLVGTHITYLVDSLAQEGDQPTSALLGWYLPSLPETEGARSEAEAKREWQVMVATDAGDRLSFQIEDSDLIQDVTPSRQAVAAASWLDRLESDTEEALDEIGYERTFVRFLRRAQAAYRAGRGDRNSG